MLNFRRNTFSRFSNCRIFFFPSSISAVNSSRDSFCRNIFSRFSYCRIFFLLSSISAVSSSRVFSLGFVIGGRSFLPVGIEKGQSISRLPFWVGIKFYCVLFYITLIVLTLYLNGIFHHHYSIIVLIADCTALYLPSFECAAKQVIKYAFPSFSYRTTML